MCIKHAVILQKNTPIKPIQWSRFHQTYRTLSLSFQTHEIFQAELEEFFYELSTFPFDGIVHS